MGFWGFVDDLKNTFVNSLDPLNIFGFGQGNSSASQDTSSGSLLGDTWDKFKNGNSNDVNYAIAKQNLQYQKERNAIEDTRYAEETAYNRNFAQEEQAYQRGLDAFQQQFALDERDYNRALQQQLFEREDTALERQVQSLSKLGINPLSQNMNGLGAGQVVSSSAPSFEGSSMPASSSSRGGKALHNDFSAFPGGLDGIMSLVSSVGDTVNGMATGQYTRDSLQLENERKALENYVYAHQHGIDFYPPKTSSFIGGLNGWNGFNSDYQKDTYATADYDKANSKREYKGKEAYDIFDFESPQSKLIKSLGNLDFVNLAENIMTRGAKLIDNIGSKFGKELGADSLLMKFFSLFY